MAQCKFEINYELPTSLNVVYDSLLDFKKFGKLHPYMQQVDIVNDKDPAFTEYKIFEEIYLFGFIKNHPIYNAKVFEIEKNKSIKYTSWVKKFIFLTITFSFSENANGTVVVNEVIELQCNRLISYVFSDILRKAHAKVFENIRKLDTTVVV